VVDLGVPAEPFDAFRGLIRTFGAARVCARAAAAVLLAGSEAARTRPRPAMTATGM
jgi:hypothetical protein